MNNMNAIMNKVKELEELVNECRDIYTVSIDNSRLCRAPKIHIRLEPMLEYIDQAKVSFGQGLYWFEVTVNGIEFISLVYDAEIEKYGLHKYIEGVKGE